MTRQLQILIWCDAHPDRPGDTYTPNHGRRSLDLCAECQAELLEPLEQLLAEHGVTESQPARRAPRKAPASPSATQAPTGAQDDAWPCPLCDVVKPNDHQLKTHARREHGVLTLQALFGITCPVCGFQGKGRLGQHTSTRHGLNVAQAAAQGARKAS